MPGHGLLAPGIDDTGNIVWHQSSCSKQDSIATSQMSSMLHDTQRCAKWRAAIGAAVTAHRLRYGRAPVVLDIGAGTGLLSVFAAQAGAAHVYACEMFPELAQVAGKVSGQACSAGALNVWGEPTCGVTVIPEMSNSLGAHARDDGSVAAHVAAVAAAKSDGWQLQHLEEAHTCPLIPCRVDLIVTETLDSVLLGEATLVSLRHALTFLAVPDAPVVPRAAAVYASLVQCPSLAAMRDTSALSVSVAPSGGAPTQQLPLRRTDWKPKCPAGQAPLPVHWAAVHDGVELTAPMLLWSFDFTQPTLPGCPPAASEPAGALTELEELEGSEVLQGAAISDDVKYVYYTQDVHAAAAGTVHGACIWWDAWLPCGLAEYGHDVPEPAALPQPVQDMLRCGTLPRDPRPAVFSTHPRPGQFSPSARWQPDQLSDVPAANAAATAEWPWPWQDHWVQCFAPISVSAKVSPGDTLAMCAARNDSQLWICATLTDAVGTPGMKRRGDRQGSPVPEQCICGAHDVLGSQRIAGLGHAGRRDAVVGAMRAVLAPLGASATSPITVVDVSDGAAAGLAASAAQPGVVQLISLEAQPLHAMYWSALVRAAAGQGMRAPDHPHTLLAGEVWQAGVAELLAMRAEADGVEDDEEDAGIDLPADGVHAVVADVLLQQAQSAQLWAAAILWRRLSAARQALRPDGVLSPACMQVQVCPVTLHDLWRGYAPVATVFEVDHSEYARVVTHWHEQTYNFPMWQYGFTPLAHPQCIAEVDFATQDAPTASQAWSATMSAEAPGTWHAVLAWVDWTLAPGVVLSGAPPSLLQAGHQPACAGGKQAVRFLPSWPVVAAGQALHIGMSLSAGICPGFELESLHASP